ncbi:MAG: alpha/beta hydrolase [Methylotenera sp.]|nr:alpha/beta hydrolase [Oligoflexia bacterium]
MKKIPVQAMLLGLVLTFLNSCSTETQVAASERNLTPLVFIHGIKGGKLVNPKGDTQWLTGAQALSLSTPELKLPLHWVDDVQERDDLKSDGPLETVKVIPGLIQQDIYATWLKAARTSGHPFYSFAYDWRRDNLETLELFSRFIEKVRSENGGRKVQLVAHSMGGLISFAVLNQHPENFDSAVFAGVPFAGGVGFLIDLHAGDSVGTNSRILSPQVLFTFPSVYTLFPLGGKGLVEEDGSPITMDFYSQPQWKEKKLGVFSDPARVAAVGSEEKAEAFMATALAHAKTFRMLLAPRKQNFPPVLVISNEDRPTLVTAIHHGKKSTDGWDLQSAPQAPGDGRVAEHDAFPPTGVAYDLFLSKAEHTQLLNDPKVIERIEIFLKR